VGTHGGAGARAGATAQRDDSERKEEWLHHERGDGAVRESVLWGAR
jgi:hypothetical protein